MERRYDLGKSHFALDGRYLVLFDSVLMLLAFIFDAIGRPGIFDGKDFDDLVISALSHQARPQISDCVTDLELMTGRGSRTTRRVRGLWAALLDGSPAP
ncbi:hypothetical protein C5L14_03460 [Labrys okinawensis]|uniref:Uncharacterized protein n=1 Tax=Labrys okinawensis TaxID=346911 RepID=A0A2S9QJY5_9HYPH|nr:hypothetical protein C5L14_03460 [Labrys okinawensis]